MSNSRFRFIFLSLSCSLVGAISIVLLSATASANSRMKYEATTEDNFTSSEDSELSHPGYISDVSEERYQITREVVISPLSPSNESPLINRIFTEKLSKDFSKEFRDRFGYTAFEQVAFTSNRFVETVDSGRLTPVDEYISKQEQFGQYITKELIEFHVDSYLRGNRATRNVYKVKEKISNVEVATASGYKFKIRYKLASNKITLSLKKPNERLHQEMDISGSKATVHLGYDINKTVRLASDVAVQDQVYSLSGIKRLTPTLATSLTGQSFNKDIVGTPKQQRLLLGLSWND